MNIKIIKILLVKIFISQIGCSEIISREDCVPGFNYESQYFCFYQNIMNESRIDEKIIKNIFIGEALEKNKYLLNLSILTITTCLKILNILMFQKKSMLLQFKVHQCKISLVITKNI